MSDSGTRVRAMLDAWREQNADRLHPLRFHFIDALERRVATHDGEARRVLDERLSVLLGAYAADVALAASDVDVADSATTPDTPVRGALGEVIDHLVNHAVPRRGEAPLPATLPTLEALGEFQKIWSELRTESQVRQSLEQIPTVAGPLNSGSLVHRSLTLMRELSPGYLQQFLSYVDALSWMEHMNHGRGLASKEGLDAVGGKRRARAKSR